MQELENNINVIAICGNAISGKDNLYKILKEILSNNGINNERIAIADTLKSELNEFTIRNYGISAYTSNPEEKKLIRDLMVTHGFIKRLQTNGKYWTNKITHLVEENINDNIVTIVTDLRFCETTEDEYYWLRNKFNGTLIHLTRTLPDGKIVPPYNYSELTNNALLKKLSNYHLSWPTTDDKFILEDCVKIQLKELIERIINEKKCN